MVLNALAWQMPEVDIVLSNGFIYDMLPVDSNIKTGEITGKQLLEWLEKELNNVFAKDASKRFGGWVIKFQGMQIEFKAFEAMGKRVQKVLVKGKAVDENSVYKICACERDGDPVDMLCRIKGVANPLTHSFTLHKTMKDYLAKNSPVTPALPLNAKILDGPQTLLTQVYGVDYSFRKPSFSILRQCHLCFIRKYCRKKELVLNNIANSSKEVGIGCNKS